MRLSSISILLAFTAIFPAQFASGQSRIRSAEKLTEESSAVWSSIRTSLEAPGGTAFFRSELKNSSVPGGARGVNVLRGTVLSTRPAENPSELMLAMSGTNQADVTLKLADPLKGPVTPGSRVAFAGIVTGFEKDPFMLTLEVQGGDGPGRTFALVLAAGAFEEPDAVPMPSLEVNYRSRQNTGFANISLDGLLMHEVTVNDHGVETHIEGVRLTRFLATAGWYPYPHSLDNQLRYSVQVDGLRSSVTLDLVGQGTLDKQAWLVPGRNRGSKPGASQVVVTAEGTLLQRVDGIQRIRVSQK
jgi:hypothetical protein